MIIPQTRREAFDLYSKRAKSKKAKTKYDMFLGGLACCSDREFKFYTRLCNDGGFYPCCICLYASFEICRYISCSDAMSQTFSLPWNRSVVG